MDPASGYGPIWSAAWILVAGLGWWVGAAAAAVRFDLVQLDSTGTGVRDYALGALLRRLRDEPVVLGLRLRFSRFFAAAWVPLALAAAAAGISWHWAVGAWLLGAFTTAAADATGGTRAVRRLGRLRGGAVYAAWARLTLPAARLSRPLLALRLPTPAEEEAGSLVSAESRAALAAAGGRLGREERRLLRRLLAGTTKVVADLMTPWDRVYTLDAGATVAEAAAAVHASGHSRLPATEGGRVVGLVTVKDLLPRTHGAATDTGPVRAILRPVYFVRRETTMEDLLDEFQEARVHLAVVVDRLGRREGIVTMEDVLEEIVGELHDERERGSRRRPS